MISFDDIPVLRWLLGDREPESLPYVCSACGAGLALRYHACPRCGSYRIDRETWDDDPVAI